MLVARLNGISFLAMSIGVYVFGNRFLSNIFTVSFVSFFMYAYDSYLVM